MIRWFSLICESVASKSLIIEVREFSEEAEICDKIQDSLLALNERLETLSVYLSNSDRFWKGAMEIRDLRTLFPILYKKGIVFSGYLSDDESVCYYFLTSKLPY